MNYEKKYFNSIDLGLKKSKFSIKKKEISIEVFFKKINSRLLKLKKNKASLYFFGNGASSSFANHMALDFMKNGKIISKSLSDSALLTAISNDYSYDDSFVEFVKMNNITKDDFVISISSSGNSPNIVNLLKYCRKSNIESLTLSGLKPNNDSIKIGTYSIYVPMKTYGIVECCHQIFLHMILDKMMNIKEWSRNDFQNMNSDNLVL